MISKVGNKLRIVSLSDIHINVNEKLAPTIIDNLYRYLAPLFSQIDILFFVGDIFETVMEVPSNSTYLISQSKPIFNDLSTLSIFAQHVSFLKEK